MAPVIFDVDRVCRLCIREDDGQSKMTSIFEQPELEDIIKNCVQIEVRLDGFTIHRFKMIKILFLWIFIISAQNNYNLTTFIQCWLALIGN